MIPLLYANNADIKYPLSDFHEASIPNGALLDLSITVEDALQPVVGAFRVGPSFAFISIEDETTRAPIASAIITNPVSARVYPLTMDVDGYGWVVFGPDSVTGNPFYSDEVVALDPETILPLVRTASPLSLAINGFPREVRNILEIASASIFLTVSVEDGVIYVDRNDDELSTDDLISLGVEKDINSDTTRQVLYTLENTSPDENGNIDVVVLGCAEGCGDTRSLDIPRGDIGEGVTEELPLDNFTPRTYDPDDPCGPSGSEAEDPEDDDPYDGCTNIRGVDIVDPETGGAIGTLYTILES